MTGFLLDTSVLSHLAPGRTPLPAAQHGWFATRADVLAVSTVTQAEIAQGIAKLRRLGASDRASALDAWLDALSRTFAARVLAFDANAARTFGPIADAARASERHPGLADVAIAAIAAARGLTVATCNLRHFTSLGVAAIDPFAS